MSQQWVRGRLAEQPFPREQRRAQPPFSSQLEKTKCATLEYNGKMLIARVVFSFSLSWPLGNPWPFTGSLLPWSSTTPAWRRLPRCWSAKERGNGFHVVWVDRPYLACNRSRVGKVFDDFASSVCLWVWQFDLKLGTFVTGISCVPFWPSRNRTSWVNYESDLMRHLFYCCICMWVYKL